MKKKDPNESLTGSREEWEEAIFRSASHFNVFRFHRRNEETPPPYMAFPEAVKDAEADSRALIYAVTTDGRSFCIPRAQWKRYTEIWNEEWN